MACRRPGIRGFAAAVVLTMAGCATKQAEEPWPGAPEPAPSSAAPPADVRSIVDTAIRDAAAQLNVDPRTIEIVSARSVTWSDGSLGCPADGMMYTQALVPGYRVVLRVGGETLDYHAGVNGHVALCPPERAVEPVLAEPT